MIAVMLVELLGGVPRSITFCMRLISAPTVAEIPGVLLEAQSEGSIEIGTVAGGHNAANDTHSEPSQERLKTEKSILYNTKDVNLFVISQ